MHKLLLAIVLLCTSCNFKPIDPGTDMAMPDTWRFQADTTSTDLNLRWWEQFQDPLLNELIQEALEYNRDLRVAAARVYQFYAQYKIVRSQLFPEIDGNASAYRQELSRLTNFIPPGVSRTGNVFTTLLNLNYELDVWGQLQNETEAAYDQLLSQVNNRRTVVLTLVSSVAEAYLQLRQYQMQLSISNETMKSRIHSYDLQVKRYEGGLVSEMEVMQAAAEIQYAEADVIQFELSIAEQEDLISILVGHAPTAIPKSKILEDLKLPPNIPAGLPSDLLQQRPDIVSAEDQLLASNANIGVAIAEYFPQFTLTGDYGNQSNQLKNLFSGPAKTWQYGIALFQPIFTAGRLRAQVEQAKSEYVEALNTYEQTILEALKEVDNALIAHQKAQELVVVQAKSVQVLSIYLHLAILQYDNGQTDYLNVLDAERNLFNAQLDYAAALGNLYITVVEIYRALGGGWVIDADPYQNELPCCDPVLF